MDAVATALSLISGEARSLVSRLDRIMPFALHMTMVGAASASLEAQRAIQGHLDKEIDDLRQSMTTLIDWMEEEPAPAQAQKRLAFLKLRFNLLLSHFDIYSDVLVQRSEHEHGIQLAGLDAVASESMQIPGYTGGLPPVLCYLDRGQGAAIRRARTRLPGGGDNPVGLIRMPRERMVGSGIGSSLVHEVGHQVAAVLDLVTALRPKLHGRSRGNPLSAWAYFERWISEIVADYWSVLKLGITSTVGLIGVVSLPVAFVFRIGMDDPHPFPWLRVQLSCAIGGALYPDSQWRQMAAAWEQLYPLDGRTEENRELIQTLLDGIPEFLDLLLSFRPPALGGKSLSDLRERRRSPAALRELGPSVRSGSHGRDLPPTIAIAAIGQARFEGRMTAGRESAFLRELLVEWALRRFNEPSVACPAPEIQRTGEQT
ncbi:MAG: hypothetical protein ABI972_07125 [Acidobacteriota bacterium]